MRYGNFFSSVFTHSRPNVISHISIWSTKGRQLSGTREMFEWCELGNRKRMEHAASGLTGRRKGISLTIFYQKNVFREVRKGGKVEFMSDHEALFWIQRLGRHSWIPGKCGFVKKQKNSLNSNKFWGKRSSAVEKLKAPRLWDEAKVVSRSWTFR